jgi:hypothetical protein
MAGGVSDHLWKIEEIVALLDLTAAITPAVKTGNCLHKRPEG